MLNRARANKSKRKVSSAVAFILGAVIFFLSTLGHGDDIAALAAPKAKDLTDFNYSNGAVGSDASGVSLEEAGDFNEDELPLGTPKLKSAELVMSGNSTLNLEDMTLKLNSESREDSQKSLDRRN